VTRSLEWHYPGSSLDRWTVAQIFLYFSTPLTVVVSQGSFALYGVFDLIRMIQAPRSNAAQPTEVASLDLPAFIVPGWIYMILTTFVLITLVLTFIGPESGPIRAHPWLLPFMWGISAFFLVDYAISFDYAEGWPTYVIYFAAVMAVCSIVGFGAAAVRGLRKRAARRRDGAAEA
jgi:hypothetical protein